MMKPDAFLADLRRRGVKLTDAGDRLGFRAPKGVLTATDRKAMISFKGELLTSLRRAASGGDGSDRPVAPGSATQNPHNSQSSRPDLDSADCAEMAVVHGCLRSGSPRRRAHYGPMTGRVMISERGYPITFWNGEFLDGVLGFDSETDVVVANAVPQLALASASSRDKTCLIHPDRLGEFILTHDRSDFVGHNIAFDFWVVDNHLAARGERQSLGVWWELAEDNLMHDTMLLDQLIRLARSDEHPRPRNLAEVAAEYAGFEVNKSDPHRLRFGEIIGRDWADVDPSFFGYAADDAVATLRTFNKMYPEAIALMDKHLENYVPVLNTFGLLTESIQVKSAIALAEIGRRGVHLDAARLGAVKARLRRRVDGLITDLESETAWGRLTRRDRDGRVVLTAIGKVPGIDQGRLRECLRRACSEVARAAGTLPAIPLTANGSLSLKAEDWEEVAAAHPLVGTWVELVKLTKSLQFFSNLDGSLVWPRYTPLVRSGRTSCSSPNVQNLPREGGFREAFVPSPGNVLLVADYSFIELRTLAAVCGARYGGSKLADVIRGGVDPHAHTAAMFEGMSIEHFLALRSSRNGESRRRFDTLRQRAKVLNFGIPGGLGARSLVAYARSTYGVVLTEAEATDFRRRLIEDIYPEIGLYLADDAMDALARNLGSTPEDCWQRLDSKGGRSGAVAGGVRNVVSGKTHSAAGTPYKPSYVAGVWDGLLTLNRDDDLAPLLARRKGSARLRDRLFGVAAVTLTGRIRGGVGYTQARNTPFQGLAADGAKLALWGLQRAGFKVVAFVHDEFVIELPEDADHTAEAKRIETILNRSMERVTGDVPVACEYALCRRWSKKAKAVFEGGRLIPFELE